MNISRSENGIKSKRACMCTSFSSEYDVLTLRFCEKRGVKVLERTLRGYTVINSMENLKELHAMSQNIWLKEWRGWKCPLKRLNLEQIPIISWEGESFGIAKGISTRDSLIYLKECTSVEDRKKMEKWCALGDWKSHPKDSANDGIDKVVHVYAI